MFGVFAGVAVTEVDGLLLPTRLLAFTRRSYEVPLASAPTVIEVLVVVIWGVQEVLLQLPVVRSLADRRHSTV